MIKKCLFLVCSVWISFCSVAQEKKEVAIYTIDDEKKDSIRNVHVLIIQGLDSIRVKSNRQGKAVVQLKPAEDVSIKATHGLYEVFQQVYRPTDQKNKELPDKITLKLQLKAQELASVDVLAPGIPKVVFSSKELSVSDFEFLPSNDLLLLLYPKTLKKGSELGIWNGERLTTRFELEENPIELIHDFRKNPHVVCEKGVYGIIRDGNEVAIATHPKEYFMKYIFPIVDTMYTKYYFSTFNKFYPAFDYKAFDQLDSSYTQIIEIKDKLMMELYRSEYKWVDVRTKLWAKEMENETGIDKEIWVGANYFTQSIYYKELFAPMFRKHDTILIFDYYKDLLFKFDAKGKAVDSIPIFHHYNPRATGWKRTVIQDDITGEIYVYFEKDGVCSLRSVNLMDGSLGPAIVFEHRYIDKIAVHGTLAYYIYRPYESAQKKYVYQTKLPVSVNEER